MATKNGKPNNCDCKCHPTEMAGTGVTEAKACCNGLHCPSYCSCCQILKAENADRVKAEVEVRSLNLQLRAMVEERDLYCEVVDAAECWLKHHGNGGIEEAEANKALRYQVEKLGPKVSAKRKDVTA